MDLTASQIKIGWGISLTAGFVPTAIWYLSNSVHGIAVLNPFTAGGALAALGGWALVAGSVIGVALLIFGTYQCYYSQASNAEADSDVVVERETGPDSDVVVERETGPDSDVDVEREPEADSDVVVERETGPDSDVVVEREPGPDSDVDVEREPEADGDVDGTRDDVATPRSTQLLRTYALLNGGDAQNDSDEVSEDEDTRSFHQADSTSLNNSIEQNACSLSFEDKVAVQEELAAAMEHEGRFDRPKPGPRPGQKPVKPCGNTAPGSQQQRGLLYVPPHRRQAHAITGCPGNTMHPHAVPRAYSDVTGVGATTSGGSRRDPWEWE